MHESAPHPQILAPALVDAAFGADPGRAAAGLPRAAGPYEHWLRAVVLGGQGRYAAARAELARLRGGVDPVLSSLAAATEGSLLRQLGWHARASVLDGRAVALAMEPPGRTDSLARGPVPAGTSDFAAVPDRFDALCDALTGLAADALGTGRTGLALRLLGRIDPAWLDSRPRAAIRWHWVRAETALASGDAAAAREPAATALDLARRHPSVRHRVKSLLLVAAATAARGEDAAAAELAAEVAAHCEEHGLVPLGWACAMLRGGLATQSGGGDAATPGSGGDAAADATRYAVEITRRGGFFRPW